MKKLIKKIALVAVAFLAFSCSTSETGNKSLGTVSIATIAKSTPTLTSFSEALDVAGLTSTFETSGNMTVFAPSNEAIASLLSALGEPSLEQLELDQPGVLAKVLKYHVVADSRVLSTELTDGMTVNTLLGQSFTVNINTELNEITLTDVNPLTDGASYVTARDIKCSNGLVHTIDSVLLPNLE
jgi:uncharacterized surface protein with fasciclin (FAS1) repeats